MCCTRGKAASVCLRWTHGTFPSSEKYFCYFCTRTKIQGDMAAGRGRGLVNVCASFLRCVRLFPAPAVCEFVSVCVCACGQFEGHPVSDCSAALSHPHTSLPFYLPAHLSAYLTPKTDFNLKKMLFFFL